MAQERGAATCPRLLARLLGLPDEEVPRILIFLMSQTLHAGSAIIEVLSHLLAVDMDQWWSPDEAFFQLLRDNEAIKAMLAEVAGQTASIHLAKTAKTQNDAIRHSLAGTGGRRKIEGCSPVLPFPDAGLFKAQGLPQIERKAFRTETLTDPPGSAERCCPVFSSLTTGYRLRPPGGRSGRGKKPPWRQALLVQVGMTP